MTVLTENLKEYGASPEQLWESEWLERFERETFAESQETNKYTTWVAVDNVLTSHFNWVLFTSTDTPEYLKLLVVLK